MKYTEATYGYAHKHGFLNNALLVDLYNPNGTNNMAYHIDATTTKIPPNLSWGIREVMYINDNKIMVRITGIEKDGATSKLWINIYNYGNWSGWQER